jgi:4-amino-4-deoxy-L-arabinose transferase-like glycosyltransferase
MTDHNRTEVGSILIAVVVAATGFATLLWCTTPYSLGLSPDSISYLSTANSVTEGTGFYRFDGEPYCHWPPLLPLVICIIQALGFDAVAGMRVVNAAAFVLLVALACDMLRRFVPSKPMLALGLCALLSPAGIFQVSCYLWSENLFNLLVLLFLWIASRHSRNKDCWNPFIGGTVVALSILTRWIGVAVFLTGLTLLFSMGASNLREKLKRAVIFSVVALTPAAIWVMRNLSVCGSPMGSRGESSASLYEYLRELANALSQWFLPADFSAGFFPPFVLPVLIDELGSRDSWVGLPQLRRCSYSLSFTPLFSRSVRWPPLPICQTPG